MAARNADNLLVRRSNYPWILTFVGFLMLMVTLGVANYVFGVFFKPVGSDFGWSSAEVSAAFSFRWLSQAVVVVPLAYTVDRYGPRKTLVFAQLLVGTGVLLSSQVTSLWQFYLFQGLMVGIGAGVPFLTVTSVIARWFDAKRGMALGIAASGIGVGSILFPPLATSLINALGWREAYIALGLASLVVGVLGATIVRDPAAREKLAGQNSKRQTLPQSKQGTITGAMRSRTLWAMLVMFCAFNAAVQLVSAHLVNYAIEVGMDALEAAAVLSTLGVASAVGRLLMGVVSDRLGTESALAMSIGLVAAGALGLDFTIGTTLMWLFAFVFGLGFGGEVPLIPPLMGRFFGMARISTFTGLAVMGMATGGAIGPWLGGYVHDLSRSYWPAFLAAAILGTISVSIALQLRPPSKTDMVRIKTEG